MKTILLLLQIFCCSLLASASHLMGGYISAKQINNRKYEITTVTISDPNSPANNSTGSISIQYGDGQTEVITRTAVATENNIQRNTYVTEHTYASDGAFIISYSEPNLIANIMNVNGGFSDGLPFKISCLIRVNSTIQQNQSGVPLAFNFVKGVVNAPFHYNPTFVAGDNYTITNELPTDGAYLTNYVIPTGASINPYSGMLTVSTKMAGLYLYLIKVSVFNNGQLTSQSEVLQIIRIIDGPDTPPAVEVPNLTFNNEQGWYTKIVAPNENVSQLLTFNKGADPAYSSGAYSELFDKDAAVLISHPDSYKIDMALSWNALTTYQRPTPYFITYRYFSQTGYTYDYNIALYHGAPVNTGISEVVTNNQGRLYPNPATDGFCFITFAEPATGELHVYDCLGRLVSIEKVNGLSCRINTTSLKPGIYTTALVGSEGITTTGKLSVK